MARGPNDRHCIRRLRDVTEGTVRAAIKRGLIERGPDKLIDRDQADAAWHARHLPRYRQGKASKGNGALADARAAFTRAKIKRERDKLKQLKQVYSDRKLHRSAITADIDFLLANLHAIPERYVDWLPGVDRETTREILTRFMKLAVAEIGDLKISRTGGASAPACHRWGGGTIVRKTISADCLGFYRPSRARTREIGRKYLGLC
jgi:hypothetical protein